MATVRTKFRPSSVEGREGTLYFQVIHGRVARQINIGYKLLPSEWDKRMSEIILPAPDTARRGYLLTLQSALAADTDRLKRTVALLERTGDKYTTDKIVELYYNPCNAGSGGFIAFARELAGQLGRIGKMRTAETYTTAVNSFARFRGNRGDVPLEEVDSSLMVEYEAWLKDADICPNSTSYYMRNLRAVYNRAVEKELTVQRTPFKHVYTGIDKTVKRAVPAKDIRRIRDMDLLTEPTMDFARNMFMFSFYTRGMSFIDMAYLKKKDLQNGILTYRRQKTGQQLSIKWEKPMQEIIDKYDTSGTPYLLPIIKDMEKGERVQYRNAEHLVNGKLKKIGQRLGLAIPLTTYVARHAWASIARNKNIPIATISEAMGHDTESTTRIYLASLDTSIVDKANSIILKSI